MIPSFEARHAAGGVARPMGGGGGGGGADTAQMYTAMMQQQLSQQQLEWAKGVYQSEAPAREAAALDARQVAALQMEGQRTQNAVAAQAQRDYETTFRPVEQRLAAEAQAYDTPERRAAESASAVAQVEQQLAGSRAATMRDMERSGVDPSSGKMASLAGSMDLGAAKLKAGAGNAAARNVETTGRAMLADVANLGRGIASSQATTASLASSMGSQAVGSNAAALAAGQSGNAGMQQAYSTAINGYGAAGSTFGGIAKQQQAAAAAKSNDNAQLAAGAMSLAAMFM